MIVCVPFLFSFFHLSKTLKQKKEISKTIKCFEKKMNFFFRYVYIEYKYHIFLFLIAAIVIVNYMQLISDPDLSSKVRHSFNVLEQCLTRYTPNQIAVAFNGGKDCTVVLHQYSLVLNQTYAHLNNKPTLRALFIHNKPQFDNVVQFIDESVKYYEIDLIQIDGRIKDALYQLKTSHPDIQCVIMGTRSTDPYSSNLNDFSPTDPTWPEYMRCNPILNYSYKDVWNFLREFKVPYCQMYDQGFTSLGDKEKTIRNVTLQYQNNDTGLMEYKPAYLLEDEMSERHGRD
jgi:FAD synthetase